MRLVRFGREYDDPWFVNPEQVDCIVADGRFNTIIHMGSESRRVGMPYTKVIEMLTGEKYERSEKE